MAKEIPIMKLGQHTQVNKAVTAIQKPILPTKKLQMNIPEELHKQFKLACLSNEVDMTAVVQELIENWLEKNRGNI
ncbi:MULTISPECIES: plasmid partition protein ParG [Providencia]|uniref:plasmid partition protein ParG n=1 Tax=Providencia TaxID=586 RepID=UPI0024811F58|nr:plasmid partition protein ParG [Providencia rettgeri]